MNDKKLTDIELGMRHLVGDEPFEDDPASGPIILTLDLVGEDDPAGAYWIADSHGNPSVLAEGRTAAEAARRWARALEDLEDAADIAAIKEVLSDPEQAELVSWEDVKRDLDL